ncbi:hypothetical protein [Pseudonocardia sp.]|nr:hypothetical protein [Pseudonocardia sp.]
MITLVLAGVASLLVLAVVVRTLDVVRAAQWREVAAERRSAWERGHALRA